MKRCLSALVAGLSIAILSAVPSNAQSAKKPVVAAPKAAVPPPALSRTPSPSLISPNNNRLITNDGGSLINRNNNGIVATGGGNLINNGGSTLKPR